MIKFIERIFGKPLKNERELVSFSSKEKKLEHPFSYKTSGFNRDGEFTDRVITIEYEAVGATYNTAVGLVDLNPQPIKTVVYRSLHD